jgi:hypothetical protein
MSEEILKKLDERKLAARKTLLEENPRPEGYGEEQIEEMQDRWEEIFDAEDEDPEETEMAIRGGLRSGHALERWLFQGGDDWLRESLVARGYSIKRFYEILAVGAFNIKIKHAALELSSLVDEYELAGWKPRDEPGKGL